MNLYLSIGIILCFFSSISLYGEKRNKDNDNNFLYCYISLLLIGLFWILTAFRNSTIGADTPTYIRAFKTVVDYGLEVENKYFEKGYIFFSYLHENAFRLFILNIIGKIQKNFNKINLFVTVCNLFYL